MKRTSSRLIATALCAAVAVGTFAPGDIEAKRERRTDRARIVDRDEKDDAKERRSVERKLRVKREFHDDRVHREHRMHRKDRMHREHHYDRKHRTRKHWEWRRDRRSLRHERHPDMRGAGRKWRDDRRDRPSALRRMAMRLDLTDEQRDEWRDIQHRTEMDLVDLRADMKKARLELRRLRRDGNASESAVREQLERIARARVDLQMERFRAREAFKKLLTKEQRKKLDDTKRRR